MTEIQNLDEEHMRQVLAENDKLKKVVEILIDKNEQHMIQVLAENNILKKDMRELKREFDKDMRKVLAENKKCKNELEQVLTNNNCGDIDIGEIEEKIDGIIDKMSTNLHKKTPNGDRELFSKDENNEINKHINKRPKRSGKKRSGKKRSGKKRSGKKRSGKNSKKHNRN